MWERKKIKHEARKMLSRQYFTMIAVCFILAFVAGEYGDSLWGIRYYDDSKEVMSVESVKLYESISENSNAEERIVEKQQHTLTKPYGKKVIAPNSRGVFARIFRNVNANGSLFLGIVHTMLPLIKNSQGAQVLLSGMGVIVAFLWWFFVQNTLLVGEKRFFLEKINYTEVPFRVLLLPWRAGEGLNVAAAMAWKSVLLFLWWLTIVGGIIKHYSYMMVPYILAENPEIKPKEALKLSGRMMQGEKYHTFLLEFSFVGWILLGTLTMGVLDLFFINPYMASSKAQLYRELRRKMIENKIEGYEYFNDEWLFEVPESIQRMPEEKYSYPTGCFPIRAQRRRVWLRTDYMRNYSLRTLILLFFSFSVLGWLWEVGLHLVEDRTFVNRGVMLGPWLPIYGTGGILILVLLKKVRKSPLLTFFFTVLLCGVLEYGTSLFLELTKKTKWWDYSGYFLNLNGRICAEGLFVFGIGGCVFIYILAPALADLYDRIPVYRQTLICMLLILAFATDFSYSSLYPNTGKGITDYEAGISEEESGLHEIQKSVLCEMEEGDMKNLFAAVYKKTKEVKGV